MALRWVPDPAHPGQTTAQVVLAYVVRQFHSLAASLTKMEVEFVQLSIRNVAPEKPRNGMMVEADGTNWDPGSGAGLYVYRSGSWVKVG